MRDPFSNGKTVIGKSLLELIDWVHESEVFLRPKDGLESSLPSQPQSVIALPPIQRSSVWRPKQVVDLWDSIMHGLPIGMFYLVKRKPEALSGTWTGLTKPIHEPGYDLLDGQQRVRALLLGRVRLSVEKRCLWVDLGDKEASKHPVLRISSKGQPFGYDAKTGNKLSLEERRKARGKLDDKDRPILRTDGRRVTDRELFDSDELIQDGKPFNPQPPLPYGADSHCTFMLHRLLGAWREEDPSDPGKGIAALRTVAGSVPSDEALKRLHEAFERISRAEIALLCVDPDNFHPKGEGLLPLFDRIGAAGTPLSGDERLYSVYKYRYPYIRDTVNQIYEEVGRVLSPTKIAATAIRIAYVQAGKGPEIPDVTAFSRMMREKEQKQEQREEEETFRNCLERLIPQSDQAKSEEVTLLSSFRTIKSLLEYREGVGHFWIPDVVLASLPPELWQVFLFWAVWHPRLVNLEKSREEAVRFALFWYLCVFNKEKAARWAFASIKEIGGGAVFPGGDLYQGLVGNGEESCAHALISSQEMRDRLCAKEESSNWRSDADRFVVDGRRDDLISAWWWEGKKLLPWLQKEYIHRTFPDYLPLDDHEDNVPYDIDHLCPFKDWGDHWRNMKKRLDGLNQILENRFYACRSVVGNGIGNLRVLEASENREYGDADVAEKMSFTMRDHQPPQVADAEEMANFAFAPGEREIWRRVSCAGPVSARKWNESRLKAFQAAVERRAAWLYERFHDDLGYRLWTNIST